MVACCYRFHSSHVPQLLLLAHVKLNPSSRQSQWGMGFCSLNTQMCATMDGGYKMGTLCRETKTLGNLKRKFTPRHHHIMVVQRMFPFQDRDASLVAYIYTYTFYGCVSRLFIDFHLYFNFLVLRNDAAPPPRDRRAVGSDQWR